ncbi:MAG: hypothetical protein K2N48_00130 [Muribaculaceae bacterium]|nr:hypothetical protein [Muribaculaceae bacterium]
MVRQIVNLHEYDWKIEILYDARPKDADYILECLWDLGCEQRYLYKAERLLKSGTANEGLTYSNPHERRSIIVIGHVSNPFEICNSLMHELDHLQIAICRADGLRTDGEDAAYLIGDITEALARNVWLTMRKLFLYLI